MSAETCGVCGGDGRVSNSFGLTARCPACAGTGRRAAEMSGMRDVTKTKPSHHQPTHKVKEPTGPQVPVTHEGMKLAEEVRLSGHSPDAKACFIRDIVDYEGSHGTCTQTFQRKLRKQLRPKA